MRNRIAAYLHTFADESHDDPQLSERLALEAARWTPRQRRLRRLFARMQRRRMRRMLRSALQVAMEGARDADTAKEGGRADCGNSAGFGACNGDCGRSVARTGAARVRGGCRNRHTSGRGASGNETRRTDGAATPSPIAAAYHDRQPGDAEADAAIAAMRDESFLRRGDVVRFTDDTRGFRLEPARVINVLPCRQLVVETLSGLELVIAEADVIAWECQQ